MLDSGSKININCKDMRYTKMVDVTDNSESEVQHLIDYKTDLYANGHYNNV